MKIGGGRVVLVFHSSVRSSWQETLSGIYRYAHQCDWRLQVIEFVPDSKTIAGLLEFWHPAGIIAECGVDEKGVYSPRTFGGVPTVYLVCDPKRLRPDSLRVNHDSSGFGRLAAKEFLSTHLKSFAFFGFAGLFWSEERGRHFAEALSMNGYRCSVFNRALYEQTAPIRSKSDYRKGLVAWLKALPKPCGLMAANDMLASEAISTCASAGISVPEDVSVLGIDNDEVLCESVEPSLSSIRPNFGAAGFEAAQLLDNALNGRARTTESRRRFFPPSGVVHRASTMRLPQASASVSKALEMIRLRACEGLRPKDVFAVLPESRRTVEQRFRRLTGHSVCDEILSVRLERVKELLLVENIPLKSIAERCGWKSSARLRVFFHKAEGVSMRTWRNRHLFG